MEFPRGDYYQIVCRSGDQALKIQETDPKLHNDSRIITSLPKSDDNTQIWMIEKVGAGDDSYEVVNCLSTYVCSVEENEIRLKFGKQHKGQLFKI
jgi:hypothetical protein